MFWKSFIDQGRNSLGSILLGWFLLLGGSFLAGAPVNIDSLETVARSMPLSIEKAGAYHRLSDLLVFTETDRSLVFAEKMKATSEALANDSLLAYSFHSLGTVYSFMGNIEDAILNYTQCLEYGKKLKDDNLVLATLINMGTAYFKHGQTDLGHQELLEAEKLMDDDTPLSYRMVVYNNLGSSYERMDRSKEALKMYHEVREILPENDLRRRSINSNNIGNVLVGSGLHAQGKEFLLESLAFARGTDYHEQLTTAYINLANVDRLLGNEIQSQYWMDSIMVHAKRSGVSHVMEMALRRQSQYLADIGEYEASLYVLRRYIAYKDSTAASNQAEKVAELKAQMDLTSKEAQIEILKTRNQAEVERRKWQNYLLWSLGIGLLVVLIALVFIVLALNARSQTHKTLAHKHAIIEEKNNLLRKQKGALEDLNHEKDGLIGIVAHDLKSPLNKSLALINLIESAGPLTAAQENAIQMIRKSNEDGAELIRDLLELNSIELATEDKEISTIHAQDFLQELGATFNAEAQRKQIALHISSPEDGFTFQTHRLYLSRILENLISNALKFSQSGTAIQVGIQSRPQQVLLSVRDQGPGISAVDQRKLFKKFQRLSAAPTGGESSTGLGLAITKSLVEKLGGEIEVESKLGQGTAFQIYLPRA